VSGHPQVKTMTCQRDSQQCVPLTIGFQIVMHLVVLSVANITPEDAADPREILVPAAQRGRYAVYLNRY